jgi:Mg-chelatase subunit ChlD
MLKKLALVAMMSAQLVAGASGVAVATEAAKEKPQMDLAFCIDTTGSMQSEIDVVKSKMKELVAKLSSTKPSPNIRVGLVAFRDRDDDYVTKAYQFTGDVDKIVKDISALQANGGGDSPEAVDEGLHTAINNLSWSTDKKTVKLLFLIGDAGPHAKGSHYDWLKESKEAIAKGIQINTIGCQGLQDFPAANGTGVFQQIAKVTDGRFETLAYRQEVAGADGKKETLISSGGAVYRMKSADGSAWRKGVDALSAKGMAEPVTASASAPGAHGRAGFGGGSTRSAMGAVAAYADAPSSIARSENNLADVLLEGARDAAKKSMK